MKIITQDNKETGTVKLPSQFSEELRIDIIRKVFKVLQSHDRQPYGADPRAGKGFATLISRRRRKYRGAYGKGISRVQRKVMSRRGSQFNWVGAVGPGTVGGRKAHPPKAEKIFSLKINDKERRKAIRSAIGATVQKDIVSERGHRIPDNYPFAISKDFELIKTTKSVMSALSAIGIGDDLERSEKKKVRAGKGKSRGRKYKRKTGALLVVSKACELEKAAKNIPGVEVIQVKDLNVKVLAPGGIPGRLALFTESSIEKLAKENLFM